MVTQNKFKSPLDIQVVLSAGNIVHYTYAALALQEIGYLKHFLCTFSGHEYKSLFFPLLPIYWQKAIKDKKLDALNEDLIKTIPYPYLVTQALVKGRVLSLDRAVKLRGPWYDKISFKWLDNCDVFHFVNGMGLSSGQKIKKRGGMVFCDVRAAHLDYEEELVRGEYELLNLPHRLFRVPYRERFLQECELADVIFVPSNFTARTYIQKGFTPTKIKVVPYGVDILRFGSSKLSRRQDNSVFRIIFVGRVIPQKGLHYLLEAFRDANLANSEILVIGNSEPNYLALLIKHFGYEGVKFLGHLPQTELHQYYQQSDVFVLPSLCDSFGMVVTEAMSAGLPVIISENTGARELVRNGVDGFVVPVRNAIAICDKLKWLYENRELTRMMGKQAMDRVREYSWDRYQVALMDSYHTILKG